MHPSSLENMQRCYDRHLWRSPRAHRQRVQVLDIGGADVNGSYREIFSAPRFDYIGADMNPGAGVALVLDDPYRIPLADASVDIVISGQALEHAEFFWQLFEEMARVSHPDGLIVLIVPSAGPIHRFPVDCYRFYPDAMDALARYAGIGLIDCWMDDKGPWNDLVGVFSHRVSMAANRQDMPALPLSRFAEERAVVSCYGGNWITGGPALDQPQGLIRGELPYLDVMRRIHQRLTPRRYLEIGVGRGRSLALMQGAAVAIDPEPALAAALPARHRLYRETSDHFFEVNAQAALADGAPDLVFIDGMHLFEFALRDFINVERWATPNTLVVIDDIFPNHPAQAKRRRESWVWTGDVWKLHHCLSTYRPDLMLLALDTKPTGLLLVAGLDAKNRILSSRYNAILRHYVPLEVGPDADPISRTGALSPSQAPIDALLEVLRSGRDDSVAGTRQKLLTIG